VISDMKNDQNTLETILGFLRSINIQVGEQNLPLDTFLPGVSILRDTILIDPKQLKYPGDVLHEAGHIATTEKSIRSKIGTSEMDQEWPSDGEEIATVLWSYAACVHLNLDLEVVFHPSGYKNESEWLIEQFNNKNYIGLPLLEWMGLCTKEEFPLMRRWLR